MSTMANSLAWRPTPFILATIALHGAVLLLALVQPEHWPWALAALLFNHVALATAGLSPSSELLGPNITRLPPDAAARREVALTFDDGPDPAITPKVLDILDAHGAKATFFCIGERVAAHPDLCRDIVARGHYIENHGQHHRNHAALYGIGGWRREVGEAQQTIGAVTGRRPRYFRALAGFRNPFLDPVLSLFDLHQATWTRRAYDTRCRNADTVLKRLTRNLEAGDILLLHDGHSARGNDGRPVILDALPRLLTELKTRGLHPVPLDEEME